MSVAIVVVFPSIQNVSIGTINRTESSSSQKSQFSLFSSFIPLWESAGLQDLFDSALLMVKYNSSHLFLLQNLVYIQLKLHLIFLLIQIQKNPKKSLQTLRTTVCTNVKLKFIFTGMSLSSYSINLYPFPVV